MPLAGYSGVFNNDDFFNNTPSTSQGTASGFVQGLQALIAPIAALVLDNYLYDDDDYYNRHHRNNRRYYRNNYYNRYYPNSYYNVYPHNNGSFWGSYVTGAGVRILD